MGISFRSWSDPAHAQRFWSVAPRLLAGVYLVLALVIALLRMFGDVPNFDEHTHIHYAELVYRGLVPTRDFWCHYPPFFYFLLKPVWGFLPHAGVILLVARVLTFLFAGLYALLVGLFSRRVSGSMLAGLLPLFFLLSVQEGSLFIEFRSDLPSMVLAVASIWFLLHDVTPTRAGLSLFFASLSFYLMPKTISLAAFGLVPAFLALIVTRPDRWRILLAALLGGLAGTAFTVFIFHINGASLFDSLWLSYFVHASGMAHETYSPTLRAMLTGLFKGNWFLYAVLAPLLLAVFLRVRRQSLVERCFLIGAAVGVTVFCLVVQCPYTQYVVPPFALLALMTPYALGAVWQDGRVQSVLLALAIAASGASLGRYLARTGESPVFHQIALHDGMYSIVPEDETVVAAPFTHPLLRRDAGFVFFDNKPSSESHLQVGDPRRNVFRYQTFMETLEKRPPGLFCLLNADNLPAEYATASVDFLNKHGTDYVTVNFTYGASAMISGGLIQFYVRTDLVAQVQARMQPPASTNAAPAAEADAAPAVPAAAVPAPAP